MTARNQRSRRARFTNLEFEWYGVRWSVDALLYPTRTEGEMGLSTTITKAIGEDGHELDEREIRAVFDAAPRGAFEAKAANWARFKLFSSGGVRIKNTTAERKGRPRPGGDGGERTE